MSDMNVHPLQRARKKLGIKQKVLADLTGLSEPTIKRAESGKLLDTYTVSAICDYFSMRYGRQVSAEELGLRTQWASEEQLRSNSVPKDNLSINEKTSLVNTDGDNDAQLYQTIAEYLTHKRTQMLSALLPGSTNLRVEDIIGNKGLFIPLPWEMLQDTTPSTNLVRYLIDMLSAGKRILLLGDAGQGKTTVLKRVFNLLANRFLNGPKQTYPIPLYIPLREFSSLAGSATEILWSHLQDELPLSFDDFVSLMRKREFVFLFDGFDEIRGELTQQSINERAASKIFALPSVLTCRKSFFEFYLSMSSLQEYYPQWIELRPLTLTQSVSRYITSFYQHKQNKKPQKSSITPESIISTIQKSQELRDLARRPLLLVMMLDIFTDFKETKEEDWSVTKLYGKYTEKWLKNEAAKPGSLLKWNEKAQLLQEVSWLTYTAKVSTSSPYQLNQSETFTQNELASILKNIASRYHPITEPQLLDELCFHTLLAVSEGDNYYFLHKTFHEYYVAKYIFERMRIRSQQTHSTTAIGEILQEVLPFEVVTFLKEMLNSTEIAQSERDLIANNLINVYQAHRGDDLRLVTIRQHASHYLASLGTPHAVQFLERVYQEEPNKWVQRGIMVGLALYCDRMDILEKYITMIRSDPEAASINLGYHLVYYGDQAQENGYYDQKGKRCDGTLRSLFRHLSIERHRNSWPLDILTLSMLLETRGIAILAPYKQEVSELIEFLKREQWEPNSVFQREKEHLEKILQGADLWK